ncbi:MAG: hypothetical protein IJ737_02705 [Ruminococcus sp.]|nr:hypothetical protein [Ruminococcus sp.]
MKKTVTALAAALLLCGCARARGDRQEPVKLPEDMQTQCVFTVDDRSYEAQVERRGPDLWQWEFTAPETLEGLSMTVSGDTVRLGLEELSWSQEREGIPESSPVILIDGALDALIAGRGIECIRQGDILVETGESGGNELRAELKGGKLLKIEIDGWITAEFS